jgi:NAD(P)-dependent dehydrogenase (short-subunit alcohol dehydrogenase family)
MKKIIIITGSEGTIGKSLSNFLSSKNFEVINIDIKKIKKKNYFKCDICNENEAKKTIIKIYKKYKKIDALINAASYNPKQTKIKSFKISNYSLTKWNKNTQVDIIGTFTVSKNVLRVFEKQRYGTVINISSNYGLVGPDQDIYYKNKRPLFYGKKPIEYSMCKSATIGLTKGLAAFYKNSKIKILCLVFGGIMEKHSKTFIKKYSNKTILGRMINQGEYNEIIEFIIDKETQYLTGSIIDCSGGSLSIL